MNRRSFISLALLSPFIRIFKPREIKLKGTPVVANQCWSKNRIDYILQDTFYGIPYHENNATSGTWLGFSREATGILDRNYKLPFERI